MAKPIVAILLKVATSRRPSSGLKYILPFVTLRFSTLKAGTPSFTTMWC